MEGLLEWVGNILFFLVFITVADNLLPGKKYSRYLRLCAGMVLILLVLRPITHGFHLEEQITRWFEAASLKQDVKDLSKEILGIESERLSRVIDSYEEAVEADINAMAEEMGLGPVRTRVVIQKDPEALDYGSVIQIRMEAGSRGKDGEGTEALEVVNPVEPVTVTLTEETVPTKPSEDWNSQEESSEDGTWEQLKRKVERYYGLEAGKVEIRLEGK